MFIITVLDFTALPAVTERIAKIIPIDWTQLIIAFDLA